MAYTGTGTEADPFVVSTYSDLKYVTDNNGSYGYYWVKIADDINCADDPNYTGVQTTPLYVTQAHIYADTPKCIEGLTVNAEYFMYTSSSSATYINNIYFKNCVFKATSNNSAIYMDRYSMGMGNFTNCKFSMIVNLGSFSASLFRMSAFTNCAGYFKVINTDTDAVIAPHASSSTTTPQVSLTNSNFIVDGLKTKLEYSCILNGGTDSAYLPRMQLTTSSLIYKNCYFNGAGGTLYLNYTFGQIATCVDGSYVALLNPSFSGTVTAISGASYPYSSAFSLFAIDDTNVTLNDTTSNGIGTCYTSNLADKEWLLSVGFLP